MKFKSDIEVQVGLKDNAGGLGAEGEVLSSTGTGVEWLAQSAISASSNFTYYEVKNSTGLAISKGKAVMAVGTDGNSGHILIDELIADGTIPSRYFLGVLETTLNNGEIGRVVAFGELDQFNTLGQNGETWVDGQVLWCDPVNAGDFTITEPDGPNLKIPAAFIMNAATNGKIQVRVQTNEGVKDLYDTSINGQIDGDVLAWNNTSKVWFNDSTLNVDYTNSRIGIGTTSPGSKLEVIGPDSSVPTIKWQNGNARKAGYLYSDSGGIAIYDTQLSQAGIYMMANTRIDFRVNGSERMRIDSNGNVGIGTTSPGRPLHVIGQMAIANAVDASSTGALLISCDSASNKIYSRTVQNATGAHPIDFIQTSSTVMRIASNGNVGIGTTSPVTKLQVGSGTADDVARVFYSDSTYTEIHGYGIETNRGTAYFRPTSDKTQTLNIGNDSRTWNIINYNSNTHTFTNDLNEWMRIDSIGNVGIGTTAPGTKLEIRGTDPLLELNTASATGNPYMMWSQAGTRRSYMQHVDSGDNLTIASEYGGMVFMTGTSGAEVERMRITSSGSIGIDTTFPIGDFGIGSTSTTAIPRSIYLSSKSTGDSGGQSSLYLATSTGGIGEIGFGRSQFASQNLAGFIKYTDATDTFVFRTNFGDRMYLNSNGDLGVGVASPATKLSVNGGVQVAHEPDAASAALVGTLRYRTSLNNSYVDMCMQTGATTYAWVNIVSNTW